MCCAVVFVHALPVDSSVTAYYEDASTHRKVDQVRVPLLCVSAEDDPIADVRGVPVSDCRNELVAFVVARRGGHLGFVDAVGGLSGPAWVDRVAESYCSQLLDSGK